MAKPSSQPSKQPLIIEYTNLLHRYRDPNAREVRAFVAQHQDDPVFVRRAAALDIAFRLKAELIPLSGPEIDRAIEKEENKDIQC
jgi:hypothetical protein